MYLRTQVWFRHWMDNQHMHGWLNGACKTIHIPQLVSENEWRIVRKIQGQVPKPSSIHYFDGYNPRRKYTHV